MPIVPRVALACILLLGCDPDRQVPGSGEEPLDSVGAAFSWQKVHCTGTQARAFPDPGFTITRVFGEVGCHLDCGPGETALQVVLADDERRFELRAMLEHLDAAHPSGELDLENPDLPWSVQMVYSEGSSIPGWGGVILASSEPDFPRQLAGWVRLADGRASVCLAASSGELLYAPDVPVEL